MRNYNITTEKINKICTRCGIEKPLTLEYFKKDRTMKNGLSSRCKECDSIIKHEKYCKEHEEEIKTKEERDTFYYEKYSKQKFADILNDRCPNCGGELIKRNGKYGEFKGCSNYPHCRFILNVDKDTGKIIMKS